MFLCNAVRANSVQQRTEFATSVFRQKVLDAIEFRNRFAQRPFLCSELIEPENVLVCCIFICIAYYVYLFYIYAVFCQSFLRCGTNFHHHIDS